MPEKTVRANLSDLEHRQFSVLAADRGLSRTQLTEQLVRGFLAEQLRLFPSLVGGIVEETRTRDLTTRQFARLKKLQELVPGCSVNNPKDRVLTYPLRFEAAVLEFLSNCPKGSRNEAKNRREAKVYTAMNPTDKPGLKAAKKERVNYESKHVRIFREAKGVLESGPKELDELFAILKSRKQVPDGFNPKGILKSILTSSGQYSYDKFSKVISKIQPEEDPLPEVDNTPSVVTNEETPQVPETAVNDVLIDDEDILDTLNRAVELNDEPPPVSETNVSSEPIESVASDDEPPPVSETNVSSEPIESVASGESEKFPPFFPFGLRWSKVS